MPIQAPVKATTTVQQLRSLSLTNRERQADAAFVPGLGNVDIGVAIMQPAGGTILLTINGFEFSTATPFMIQVHPRQSQFDDNRNNGYLDQFATQVISTDFNSITVLVTRVNPDNEGDGWGQDLELDLFIVE